mgnify:CR=1 FL=1
MKACVEPRRNDELCRWEEDVLSDEASPWRRGDTIPLQQKTAAGFWGV